MFSKPGFIIKLTIVAFIAILSLPLVQGVFRLFQDSSLVGVTEPIAKVKISWSNWFSGGLQKYLEQRLDKDLGFKGFLVKTDNQLNFWLFHEIHQKTQNKLIVGKNNYIFEKSYIETYIGRDVVPISQLEERVRTMHELQEKLKSNGLEFVFLISPDKAGYVPENIPDSQLAPEGSLMTINANYENLIPLLKKYEINYFDGRKYFIDLKKVSRYPLFPKAGTHWSIYGACLVSNELLGDSGRMMDKIFNTPNCENVKLSSEPLWQDKDLADLTNLWFKQGFNETLAYPQLKAVPTSSINSLKLLLIGDSFSWNLLRNLNAGPFFETANFYYYFNTDNSYPGSSSRPVQKSQESLKKNILSHNLVVIEANETALPDIGFGFIEAALKALK